MRRMLQYGTGKRKDPEIKIGVGPFDPQSFYRRSAYIHKEQSSKLRCALSDMTNSLKAEEYDSPLKTTMHVARDSFNKNSYNFSGELELACDISQDSCNPQSQKKMPVDNAMLKISDSSPISVVNSLSHKKKKKKKSSCIISEPDFDKMVEEYHNSLRTPTPKDSSVTNFGKSSEYKKTAENGTVSKLENFQNALGHCVVRLEKISKDDLKALCRGKDIVIKEPNLPADQLIKPQNKKLVPDNELLNSSTKKELRKRTPRSKNYESESNSSQTRSFHFTTDSGNYSSPEESADSTSSFNVSSSPLLKHSESTPSCSMRKEKSALLRTSGLGNDEPDRCAEEKVLKSPVIKLLDQINTRKKFLSKTPVSDLSPVSGSIKRKLSSQSKHDNANNSSQERRHTPFPTPDSTYSSPPDTTFSCDGSRSSLKYPHSRPSYVSSVCQKYTTRIPECLKKPIRHLSHLNSIQEHAAESTPHCDLYEFKEDGDNPEQKKRKVKPKTKKKASDESFVLYGVVLPNRSPMRKILRSHRNSPKQNLSKQVTAAATVSFSPREPNEIIKESKSDFNSMEESLNDPFEKESSFNSGNLSIKDNSMSNKENISSVSRVARRSKWSSDRSKYNLESNKENIDLRSPNLPLNADKSNTQNFQENTLTSGLGSPHLQSRQDVTNTSSISKGGNGNVDVDWNLGSEKFGEDYSMLVQNISCPSARDGLMEKSKFHNIGTFMDCRVENNFGFDEEPEGDFLCSPISSENLPGRRFTPFSSGFSSTPCTKEKLLNARPTRLQFKPSVRQNHKGKQLLQSQHEPSKNLDPAHPAEMTPRLISASNVDTLRKELDLVKKKVTELNNALSENIPAVTHINERLYVAKHGVSEIEHISQENINVQNSLSFDKGRNLSGQQSTFAQDPMPGLDRPSDVNNKANTVISEEVQTELSFSALTNVEEAEIRTAASILATVDPEQVEQDSPPIIPAPGSPSSIVSSTNSDDVSPISFVSSEPVSTSPHLFNDDILPFRSPKTPRRSYCGRHKSEKSFETVRSDSESDEEVSHKSKTKKSKKEEKAMEKQLKKWAANFNAQCEDIEHFDLCVE